MLLLIVSNVIVRRVITNLKILLLTYKCHVVWSEEPKWKPGDKPNKLKRKTWVTVGKQQYNAKETNQEYKDTQLFREGDYSLIGATTGKLMQATKTNKIKSEVTQWKYNRDKTQET